MKYLYRNPGANERIVFDAASDEDAIRDACQRGHYPPHVVGIAPAPPVYRLTADPNDPRTFYASAITAAARARGGEAPVVGSWLVPLETSEGTTWVDPSAPTEAT